MITVLHTESSPGWGGQENRTVHECVGLRRLGARAIILCSPGSRLASAAAEAGVEVIACPMRSNRDIPALLRIMRAIREEKVDVVSTHSGDDSLLGAVAGRLSSRRPVIVRTRHLSLPITSKATYSLLPHMVVTVSESVREYLVGEKGLSPGRVVAIPTGVDLARFDPGSTPDTFREGLGFAPDKLVVGTVAILRRKKGHHVLLEAAATVLAQVPEAVFVFAGDGAQRANLEKMAAGLGLGHSVRFLGLRRDIPSVLKGLDLFVLPTLQEALGTSILEASAMRKAVVATRTGGVPEAVREGATGMLVPPDDPAALARAIVKLLKDGALRLRMGEEGRKMVEEEFSTVKMAGRMFALYDRLLAERRR